MKKEKIVREKKITPDRLLSIIGVSPADNLQGIPTALSWKSKIAGQQVRGLFDYQKMLDTISNDVSVFGPWSMAAAWQSSMLDTFITGPIKAQARMAVGSGRNPDLIGDMNGWTYKG